MPIDGVRGHPPSITFIKDGFNETCYTKNNNRVVPIIPPLVICAISLWATTAYSYTFLENIGLNVKTVLFFAFLIESIVTALALIIFRKGWLCILLFASAGLLLGVSESMQFDAKASQIPDDGEYLVILEDDPRSASRGLYANASCQISNGNSVKTRVFFSEGMKELCGSRLIAKCSFSETSEEYKNANYMSGIHMQANIESFESAEMPPVKQVIYDIRKGALEKINAHAGEQAGILQALLCGYRPTILNEGIYENYKKCGIAHIVAVSGAHLAIVVATLAFLLRLIRLPRFLFVGASLLFIFAYLLFSGMPISAMRAATMCSLSLTSGIAKRRKATLNSLGVCAIAFILHDPAVAVSVSLFLSAASTFGIVLFANMFTSWAESRPKFVQNFLAAPLGMTLSSNIMTMPFSASIFGMLPLISPVANILIAPLFTMTCVMGLASLMVSAVLPCLAGPLIETTSYIAAPMSYIASYLAALPYSCLNVDVEPLPMLFLSATFVLFLIFFQPRVSFRLIALPLLALTVFLFIFPIRFSAIGEDRIIMLDVGQGDAFVLQSGGSVLLIDTGDDADRLRRSLMYSGISHIDAVSISHSDSDHWKALSSINSLTSTAKLICVNKLLSCECAKCSELKDVAKGKFGPSRIIGLMPGETFKVGNFEVQVLWPETFSDDGGNQDSLCILVKLDFDKDGEVDFRALFTGDAEESELEKMIDKGCIGDIDVLKVGHHGSRASLNERIMNSVKPKYALISVGSGNSYGHPTKETIDILENANVQVFRTDIDGTCEIGFSKDGISVSRQY